MWESVLSISKVFGKAEVGFIPVVPNRSTNSRASADQGRLWMLNPSTLRILASPSIGSQNPDLEREWRNLGQMSKE